jgi:hypothetical protein
LVRRLENDFEARMEYFEGHVSFEEMDESQGQLRPRQLWNSGYRDLSELQLINYYWIVG